MTKTNKAWYVVHVPDPRRIKTLSVALKSISKDATMWVPTQKIQHKVKSQLKEIVKPVFPSYVFMNADLETTAIEELVRAACGGRFLRLPGDKKPSSLTKNEMEHLKKVVSEISVPSSIVEQYDLAIDQAVEITNGPFLGTHGIIKELRKEKVIVEVTIFGRNVLAEVDPSSCLASK